jgi:hypothetical protein
MRKIILAYLFLIGLISVAFTQTTSTTGTVTTATAATCSNKSFYKFSVPFFRLCFFVQKGVMESTAKKGSLLALISTLTQTCDCSITQLIQVEYNESLCNDEFAGTTTKEYKIEDINASYKIKSGVTRTSNLIPTYPIDLKRRIDSLSSCTSDRVNTSYNYAKVNVQDSTKSRLSIAYYPQWFDIGESLYDEYSTDITPDKSWSKVISLVSQSNNLWMQANQASFLEKLPDFTISLDQYSDLTIERVKIYKRSFIYSTFHEYLAFCVGNGVKKYFFIVDRGNYENVITRIRIIYYGTASDCKNDNALWGEILAPGMSILKVNGEGVPLSGKTSFKKFIRNAVQYTYDFPLYNPVGKNCQHFATGFFNTITGASLLYTDINLVDPIPPSYANMWNN